jgi:hypothetical protein
VSKRGCALLWLTVAAVSISARPPAPAVRFHHLHYLVDDPGAAMRDAVRQLNGASVILQGVGVGVRSGREYLLFDRATSGAASPRASDPARAYAEAVRWLASAGIAAQPASFAETSMASASAPGVFDHLAFAALDPREVVFTLRVQPRSASEDSVRFSLASGSVVEIVRETDAPDTYWCPMHLDVRRPGAGKCPRCGMALVPIPPPRLGEYRLDVALDAERSGALSGLRLVVRDPGSQKATTKFVEVHERLFHLFVVSRDLSRFEHLHPTQAADGSFVLRHQLPPGQYVLIADFLPAGGTPQLIQRAFVTPDYRGPMFGPLPDLQAGELQQDAGGLRIRLAPPSARAGRESRLQFEVTDAAAGTPVADLEPYLGASGHLLAVSRDAAFALHAHPEGAPTAGPVLTFDPVFPSAGRYKLWLQVQRKGEVLTTAFVINAE